MTGLEALASFSCSQTELIWLRLEMLSPKKMTPAACPSAIASRMACGTVVPE